VEARHLLARLRDFGVFDLAISGGEPLVRPDMLPLIEYATSLGLRVGLGSNGSMITEAVCDQLAQSGLDRLQISLDGTLATHDEVRRWNGLFAHCMRAIAAARNHDLRVHVCFTVHRRNWHELSEVASLCADMGVARLNVSRIVPTGRAGRDLDLSPAEWEAITSSIERLRKRFADVLNISTHLAQTALLNEEAACSPGFIGCQAGIGQGCIGARGEVMPCVLLPVVIGNIREKDVSEIWLEAPELVSLRQRSLLKGACGTCAVREKCGGCRAVAYGYTGDLMASDPRCWKWNTEVAAGSAGGARKWPLQLI
jgi:radical SAM protein with 4Fe4S-binding SPASM domain